MQYKRESRLWLAIALLGIYRFFFLPSFASLSTSCKAHTVTQRVKWSLILYPTHAAKKRRGNERIPRMFRVGSRQRLTLALKHSQIHHLKLETFSKKRGSRRRFQSDVEKQTNSFCNRKGTCNSCESKTQRKRMRGIVAHTYE